jgi:hypothetical protein
MAVLQENEQRFHETKQREREKKDERQPENNMDPVRGTERKFHRDCTRTDDCSDNEDYEDRRSITGVEAIKREAASLAARRKFEVTVEQGRLTTAWTARPDDDNKGRDGGRFHAVIALAPKT